MSLSWLAVAGYGLLLLLVFRFILRAALARTERQLIAAEADARRRMRVAAQRALAGVQPELRTVVEDGMKRAEDEALWLQELVMPPTPLTFRGLMSSALTVRRLRRLQLETASAAA